MIVKQRSADSQQKVDGYLLVAGDKSTVYWQLARKEQHVSKEQMPRREKMVNRLVVRHLEDKCKKFNTFINADRNQNDFDMITRTSIKSRRRRRTTTTSTATTRGHRWPAINQLNWTLVVVSIQLFILTTASATSETNVGKYFECSLETGVESAVL